MAQQKKLTIGIFQLPIGPVTTVNVANAVDAITEAKAKNSKLRLAILPESFNAPYGNEYFARYAEKVPEGYTCQAMSTLAKTLGIYLIAGSIIERVDPDKLYNTCTVWSPTGQLMGRYRKMHLFQIDIAIEHHGGVRFNEAETLSPGHELTIVEIDNHKIGLGICHDKRFDELARLYRNRGCEMLVYPSAFCICQGPMHWELLQRARANDNQLFVVTCAPARDNMTGYVDYGHSMVVDPWARVQREAGMTREVLVEDIDFGLVDAVRTQIPLFPQRRTDVYATKIIKQ